MPWTPDVSFVPGVDFFDEVVRWIGVQDWQLPSSCAGWTALNVLGHIEVTIEFVTLLLRGEQPEWQPVEPPSKPASGDSAPWWTVKVEAAMDIVRGVNLAKVVDSGQGLGSPDVELFAHGWDLARSISQNVEIPDEAIAFTHETLERSKAAPG